ncbi:hypothetical protein CsSME_00043526 [Camellia sinensis var. sinensis]
MKKKKTKKKKTGKQTYEENRRREGEEEMKKQREEHTCTSWARRRPTPALEDDWKRRISLEIWIRAWCFFCRLIWG